ncbi:MAG: (d)CMP kinase [Candidatus Cloacimonadaceae bacterium]
MRKLIIAIDGPAASGKSTAARLFAKRLRYAYIDTGAMYRACALAAKEAGIDMSDESALDALMDSISISIKHDSDENKIYLNGKDVSAAIRKPEISGLASGVSAHATVRNKMVDLQREMGAQGGVVLDGRDIGTVVFPDADLKFFFVAPARVRAQRRFDELIMRGEDPSFEDVLNDMIARDEADSSRTLAPLVPAEDSIHIDTGALNIEEMIDLLYAHYLKKVQAK